MPTVSQQNPDGTWSSAEPAAWQGGPDWEVAHHAGRYTATLFDKSRVVASFTTRSRLVLHVRMAWISRRTGKAAA